MPGPKKYVETERELLAAARRAEMIRDNPETDPDRVADAETLADEYRARARVAREREMRTETVIRPKAPQRPRMRRY